MPERTVDTELHADLEGYFAATTSTALPPGVSRLSAATLRGRRRSLSRLLARAGGALLAGTAAVALGVALAHVAPDRTGSASKSAGGAAAFATPAPFAANAPAAEADPTYPGVDARRLAAAGRTRLRTVPSGTTPPVGADAARSAAAAAEGTTAGSPGPGVLAEVEDLSGAPVRCLCWVVDVPVMNAPAAGSAVRTVLVFIDATTGRYAGAHTGDGVP